MDFRLLLLSYSKATTTLQGGIGRKKSLNFGLVILRKAIITVNFVSSILNVYLSQKLQLGTFPDNLDFVLKLIANFFRAQGEWRMLIFDGFESHLNLELIEFCLNHKIIPFCLPAHTSHILQPLDVGVFSAVQKYYGQEVTALRVPIDKNNFPNLVARARLKAFSKQNIASGFRATGKIIFFYTL